MLDITTTKQAIKNRLKGRKSKTDKVADYEVLIIGAGIAGIGMACRLQQQQHNIPGPYSSFALFYYNA